MKTKTHFAFRVDIWDAAGDSILEHVAGVEDYQVALATCCQVRVSQSVQDIWPEPSPPKDTYEGVPETPPFLLFGRDSRLMRPGPSSWAIVPSNFL
jgi:hypothetical protein